MRYSIFFLVILSISINTLAQNKFSYNHQIITQDGKLYLGNIKSYHHKKLYFYENFKILKSNELPIEIVRIINGDIPKFRSKAVLKDNSNVIFNKALQNITIAVTDSVDSSSVEKHAFSRVIVNREFENPEEMYKKHNKMGWISVSICGAGIAGMVIGNNIDNFNVGFLSGLVSLGGIIMGVHHSSRASYYRELKQGEKLSLRLSEEGLGITLHFNL